MEVIIEKFVAWWRSPTESAAAELFHQDLNYTGCALGNERDEIMSLNDANRNTDLNLVKVFTSNCEGMVVFEETDEITNLYYRHSLYFKFQENRIIEVVATKESVANESMRL
jgi:hypothetical protein